MFSVSKRALLRQLTHPPVLCFSASQRSHVLFSVSSLVSPLHVSTSRQCANSEMPALCVAQHALTVANEPLFLSLPVCKRAHLFDSLPLITQSCKCARETLLSYLLSHSACFFCLRMTYVKRQRVTSTFQLTKDIKWQAYPSGLR